VHVPELALGVLLVAGGGLGAVVWAGHEPTHRVLVAARTIERGETLDASMLRWASVSGDAITAVADPATLSGQLAAVEIPNGAPVQATSFRPPTTVGLDQVEVGLALDAGDYPAGLAVGDHVLVVIVPPPDNTGAPVPPTVLPAGAEVLAVPGEDLAPGVKAVVNLLVERTDAPALAAAADVRIGRVEVP
jgi:hypothetical protein